MQEKYSDENWGSQWIDLCDGKSELSKTINKISSDVGIKFNILRNHIVRNRIYHQLTEQEKKNGKKRTT